MQYNLNEFTPKSTSIYLSEFTQFTPNLTRNLCPVEFDQPVKFQIRPGMKYWLNWAVFHARSNSTGRISNLTGHEILLNLGVNSWIYTQFEQYFRPGRIGYHPNEFTPILSSISCPVEFNWARNTAQFGFEIHGFTPNLSSISGLVKLGIIPMNLLPF